MEHSHLPPCPHFTSITFVQKKLYGIGASPLSRKLYSKQIKKVGETPTLSFSLCLVNKFLNFRILTDFVAEIIKLSASDLTCSDNFNLLNVG